MADHNVKIIPGGDGAFDPANLPNVKKGDRVVWQNTTGRTHTATSDDGGASFNTGDIAGGTSSQPKTINNDPGPVPYHCTHHATMKAKLTVV